MSWYSDGEKPTKGDLIRSGDWDEEVETNYEAIMNLSLDELAHFLFSFIDDDDFGTVEEIKKWLRRNKYYEISNDKHPRPKWCYVESEVEGE